MKIKLSILKSLKDNDGLTLVNGEPVSRTKGYQVATDGMETTDPRIALKTIKEYNGNAGIWFSKNVFYVDHSHYVEDLETAIKIGKEHNQQSIFEWETQTVIWL